ncbi:hypothetical protein CRENBAI_017370 [Crenichthys baileyi]|uniref:Uncharacterized protein n=1 Tax=Crenichthys baileyi TaxID=28760 RepID=A0AAV9S487_9TELE
MCILPKVFIMGYNDKDSLLFDAWIMTVCSVFLEARQSVLEAEELPFRKGVTIDLMSDEEDGSFEGASGWIVRPPSFRSQELSDLCLKLQKRLEVDPNSFKDKDYLKVDQDRVRLIWHMDSNKIHMSFTKRLSIGLTPGSLHVLKEWADKQCPTTDTEGIVDVASFCRETWCYEFHAMGSHSGTLYTAAPST